jgi:hypothetical protein
MSDTNTFGGFQAIADFLTAPAGSLNDQFDDPIVDPTSSVTIADPVDDEPIVDPSTANTEPEPKPEPISKTEPVVTPDPVTPEPEPVTNTDTIDLTEEEPLIASYLQEKLYDKFGWNLNEEEPKLNSVDDIVEFLKTVVEESSVPTYASQEIERLNEYVMNGGKIEKYLEQRYSGNVDLTNVRLDNSADQTLVLREYFKRQGHDASVIERKIQKYEDAGIMEDEAKEAFSLLKKSVEKEAQTLLEEQQKVAKETQKRQQDYYNSVVSYIESLQDVLGVPVSAAERKKLQAYMFKPDTDGVTKFKKDYESSIAPLVQAAYLTMNGNTLVNKVTKKASSDAVKALKLKLETKTKRNKNTGYSDTEPVGKPGDYSPFHSIASAIGGPQF